LFFLCRRKFFSSLAGDDCGVISSAVCVLFKFQEIPDMVTDVLVFPLPKDRRTEQFRRLITIAAEIKEINN
jgi:hypothetical protein